MLHCKASPAEAGTSLRIIWVGSTVKWIEPGLASGWRVPEPGSQSRKRVAAGESMVAVKLMTRPGLSVMGLRLVTPASELLADPVSERAGTGEVMMTGMGMPHTSQVVVRGWVNWSANRGEIVGMGVRVAVGAGVRVAVGDMVSVGARVSVTFGVGVSVGRGVGFSVGVEVGSMVDVAVAVAKPRGMIFSR